MHSTIFLNKFIQKSDGTEGTKYYIFMQSKFFDDHIEFLLQDTRSNKCFKAQVSVDELKESAADLEIPYEEFYGECRKALTNYRALPGFECEIKRDDDGEHNEEVFKLIKTQDLDIIYIEMKLKELKNNYEMLETAVELLDLQEKNASIKQEKDHKVEEGKYQEDMTKMKDNLLKKFTVLLNSKKAKIAQLQEQKHESKRRDSAEEDDMDDDVDSRDDDDLSRCNNEIVGELDVHASSTSGMHVEAKQHTSRISATAADSDDVQECQRVGKTKSNSKKIAVNTKEARNDGVDDFDDDSFAADTQVMTEHETRHSSRVSKRRKTED